MESFQKSPINLNYSKVTSNLDNISINSFNLNVETKVLFQDSPLSLSNGNIYGLIGKNGCGKTTLIRQIAERKLPINEEIMILCVEQEIEGTELTPVEILLKSNRKMTELKTKIEMMESKMEDETQDLDEDFYENYEFMVHEYSSFEVDKHEPLVRKILNGLGFSDDEMDKPSKLFSGGWRMRISLARALYIKPDLLLLDEPTNHLDLDAVMWLGDYLEDWDKMLLLVSHNVGFLNQVCTHMLNIEKNKLVTYKGNYNQFKRNYNIKQKSLLKEYTKYEKKLKQLRKKNKDKSEIRNYIEKNNVEKPERLYNVRIDFPKVSEFRSHIIKLDDVSFSYPKTKLFNKVNFGLVMESRITLIGKNGSGKSTLLKLIMESEKPDEGFVWKQNGIRLGYYHQHFESLLENDLTPIEYLEKIVPKELIIQNPTFTVRNYLGRVKLEGSAHKQKISSLSGGQKARVALVKLMFQRPHFMFLDEPTNHLDIETVEALIEGLKNYNGGIMVITHDREIIDRLDTELWHMDRLNK